MHRDGVCYNKQLPLSTSVHNVGESPLGRTIWAHTWKYNYKFKNETITVAQASSIESSVLAPSDLDKVWFDQRIKDLTSGSSS